MLCRCRKGPSADNLDLPNLSRHVISFDCKAVRLLTKIDVRFSKDPTPYKTYFSAAWSRTGRKGPYAHYYVQLQPSGGSFIGKFFRVPLRCKRSHRLHSTLRESIVGPRHQDA
jgi:uncharacterized protein (DUF2461 family)